MKVRVRDLIAAVSLMLAGVGVDAVPLPGVEQRLTEPVIRPASCMQRSGVAASDGRDFAIVWSHRCELGQAHVLVSRFDRTGAAIDEAPHVLGEVDWPEDPWIAWTGREYLVVWSTTTTLRGRIFTRDGDVGPAVTLLTGESLSMPRIAVSSGRLLVTAWDVRGQGASQALRGAVFDVALNVVGKAEDIGSFDRRSYATAGSSSGFLVVGVRALDRFVGEASLEALIVSLTGLQSPARTISSSERYPTPAAAFDGIGFVAVWTSADGVTKSVRITQSGAVGVSKEIATGAYEMRTLVWSGDQFLAMLDDRGHSWALPLDEEGLAAGPLVALIPPNASAFELTSAVPTEDRVLCVVQTSGYPYGFDMYGVMLEPRGRVISPRPFWLATSPPLQVRPVAARAQARELVLWREERPLEGSWVVTGVIIDDDGSFSAPIDVAATSFDAFISVGSDGEGFLVAWGAWDGSQEIRLARIEVTGEVSETKPVEVPRLTEDIAIGWTGENFVIASLQWGIPSTDNALSGMRVDRSGEPIDEAPFTIAESLGAAAGGFRGKLSIEEAVGSVSVLFGQSPVMQASVSADGSITGPFPTPIEAYEFARAAGLVAWMPISDTPPPLPHLVSPPERIEWGFSSESGMTIAGSIERGDLTFDTRIAIHEFGDGFLLVWDEGVTPDRRVVALQLDGEGRITSAPVELESDLADTGSPVLIATSTETMLVYEGTDTSWGTPELSAIHARSVVVGGAGRRHGVRR